MVQISCQYVNKYEDCVLLELPLLLITQENLHRLHITSVVPTSSHPTSVTYTQTCLILVLIYYDGLSFSKGAYTRHTRICA